MAMHNEPMDRKFCTSKGHVNTKVPSWDDWDHYDRRNINKAYRDGESLDAGLEGRAQVLRSLSASENNNLRQYHVNESRNKKREKREKARRQIQSR